MNVKIETIALTDAALDTVNGGISFGTMMGNIADSTFKGVETGLHLGALGGPFGVGAGVIFGAGTGLASGVKNALTDMVKDWFN